MLPLPASGDGVSIPGQGGAHPTDEKIETPAVYTQPHPRDLKRAVERLAGA
ncbi:MAG TPA: hypothetical protein VG370_25200 [Chloroflexota bacterium]|nr:hypothetical protein [Chloroflexota bacterium]